VLVLPLLGACGGDDPLPEDSPHSRVPSATLTKAAAEAPEIEGCYEWFNDKGKVRVVGRDSGKLFHYSPEGKLRDSGSWQKQNNQYLFYWEWSGYTDWLSLEGETLVGSNRSGDKVRWTFGTKKGEQPGC
jgi:hypothetical protein